MGCFQLSQACKHASTFLAGRPLEGLCPPTIPDLSTLLSKLELVMVIPGHRARCPPFGPQWSRRLTFKILRVCSANESRAGACVKVLKRARLSHKSVRSSAFTFAAAVCRGVHSHCSTLLSARARYGHCGAPSEMLPVWSTVVMGHSRSCAAVA